MLYQFPLITIVVQVLFDICLLFVLIRYKISTKKTDNSFYHGIGFILFILFGLLKLAGLSIGFGAATPGFLKIKNDVNPAVVYYLKKGINQSEAVVFAKDLILSEKPELVFEMESDVSNGLIISREFKDSIGYQFVKLSWEGGVYTPEVDLKRESFKFDKGIELANAIGKYQKIIYLHYISYVLTALYIVILIVTFKFPQKRFKNVFDVMDWINEASNYYLNRFLGYFERNKSN